MAGRTWVCLADVSQGPTCIQTRAQSSDVENSSLVMMTEARLAVWIDARLCR